WVTSVPYLADIAVFKPAPAALCSNVALNGSGVATCGPQTYNTLGNYTITVSYSGDATYAAANTTATRSTFEDGLSDNWSVAWCCGLTVVNSTSQAHGGTHSLALNVAGGSAGHTACDGSDPLSGADPCAPSVWDTTA